MPKGKKASAKVKEQADQVRQEIEEALSLFDNGKKSETVKISDLKVAFVLCVRILIVS